MLVLGVKVDNFKWEKVQEQARGFLFGGGQYKIFTPNPEMVVKARSDEYFRTVLNSGDLNLCDGFGLSIVSGAKRITGADFLLDLCASAAENKASIYLLGGLHKQTAGLAGAEFTKKFPELKIAGAEWGVQIKELADGHLNYDTVDNEKMIARINTAGAKILAVGFGMGKQEKWIYENLAKMPAIKIAIGIGGALDFYSGAVARAPLLLRKIGLEWAYRWWQEPRRAGRIFNATVKFIYYYARWRT